MPPKKKGGEEAVVLLGRPGNNVKIGLVGLPNVGKSSLFNLFGGLQVAAENYPFCTIDPANTQVAVPDKRFKDLCAKVKPKKEIPAVLTVTDIAGLVKGAAEGKGLGNAFLSNIQAVDAIYHVTRAFIDKDIEHVEGDVNPCRDFEIIRHELIAKDTAWMEAEVDRRKKLLRSKPNDKEMKDNFEASEKVHQWLQGEKEVRKGTWTSKEVELINTWPMLTAKPVTYLINISKKNYLKQANKFFQEIKDWTEKNSPGDPVIPFSAVYEEEVLANSATLADKKAFIKSQGVPSKLPQIILAGYRSLSLIHYFTIGPDEVRAWSIRKGLKAPGAAGVIHGDFEKHFIKADVFNYTDFNEYGGEKGAQAAGKMRSQGKEYVFQDGDIAHFKHNAGGGKK